MSHSKGNWTIGKTGGTVVTDSDEGFPANTGHSGKENTAYGGNLIAESILRIEDAKLIAAAPELLEACKTLIQQAETCNYHTSDGLHALLDNLAISEIRKAIKKATE